MNGAVIRPYQKQDRPAIRKIACDTAFIGEPAERFFADREILADILTKYFTDFEPGSALVAEVDGKVSGYLLGAVDVRQMKKIFTAKILPALIGKIIIRGTLLHGKNLLMGYYYLRSMFKGELSSPDLDRDYPATLHINIDINSRAHGLGADLISKYLSYLKGRNITGVHFGTISEKAAAFFTKQGFQLLFKNTRSYHRNLVAQDVNFYIYGKKLAA